MLGRMILFIFQGSLYVNAQTSLYIPGFEPQSVSADVVGVGMDGRTTWALHKGSYPTASGVSSMTYPDFVGTATLVEGSHDAFLTYENSIARFTIGQTCTFAETFAVCTVNKDGSTAVQTEYMSAVPVQGASQDITMVSRDPTTITSSLPPSPPLSQGSSPNSPTSSQSQAPTSTSSRSSSHTKTPHILYFILGFQIVSLLLMTPWSTV